MDYDVFAVKVFRVLKNQCAGFGGTCLQKWNIILIYMFSFVHNHLKIRVVVFRYLE